MTSADTQVAWVRDLVEQEPALAGDKPGATGWLQRMCRAAIEELHDRTDHWLGQQGRITEPMVLSAGGSHNEPISTASRPTPNTYAASTGANSTGGVVFADSRGRARIVASAQRWSRPLKFRAQSAAGA